MNVYFRIGWLSLVFLLLVEISLGSFYTIQLDGGSVIIFALIFLPLINILIQEVKKDFFCLGFGFDRITFIKGMLLLLSIGFMYFQGFTFINSLVALYFVFSVLFVFESRVSFLVALVFLAFCPVLLITSNEAQAETFAIFAYYFLCIGVITQIRELRFHKNIPHE